MSRARRVKPKKVKPSINIMEDDEFSIEEDKPAAPSVSLKKMMEDVVKTQGDTKTPILSSFPKALEKGDKKEKKTKKSTKDSKDKSLKYINNPRLQKQLKGLTMRGVAKIMNMISTYRKTHPEEE